MKRYGILFLVLAVLCMAAISLAEESGALNTEGAPETAEPKVYDQFVIGATTVVNGNFFTNIWGNNTSDIDVRSLIHGYSPVVWTMQSRFEIDEQVVQSLTIADLEDGEKLYMVTIWNDLTYNDGTPITAKDYLFSFMLHADPVIGELDGITTNSSHIVGYDAYVSGETNIFSGLRLVDDYTFMVEIKSDYLPFFFELAMIDAIPYPISVIAPGCEVADDGDGAYIRNIDTQNTTPIWNADTLRTTVMDPEDGYLSHPYVSCGPYMLTSFNWDTREVTFDINPYYKGYYDGQKPSIDHLVLKPVTPDTMIDEFVNEEVQVLNKVVAAENIVEGLQLYTEGTAKQETYMRMGLGFISFSCEQGPTQYKAVRQAIAYAVDRDEFLSAYNQSFGYVVHGYYGIGQWMVQAVGGSLQLPVEDDAEQARWDAIIATGTSELNTYARDMEMAKQLLINDGWTLNEAGEAFQEGVDTVRYKQMDDGSLMGLTLKFAQIEDSLGASILVEQIVEPLAEIGIVLEVDVLPFETLLEHYYRQRERTYDMMYLATNFISIFDPYFVFNTDDAYQGTQNTTGLRDPQLEALALSLRQTESGAFLEYTQKWLAFQKYFNEVLPMLPLYSNVYFDFFVTDLYGYYPNEDMNWPIAMLYATIGAPEETEFEILEDESGGGDLILLD